MGFNIPKDRIVNIVNISAYFVCVLYIWCAMIVSIIKEFYTIYEKNLTELNL